MEIDTIPEADSEKVCFILKSIFDCYDDQFSTGVPQPNLTMHDLPIKEEEQWGLDIQNCLVDAGSSSNSSSFPLFNTEVTKANKGDSKTDETYPKRIRKSKYSDICGDLSHIRRGPKSRKRKGIVEDVSNQSKRKQRKTESNSDMKLSEINENKGMSDIKEWEKEKEDGLLVQELMKFLLHPRIPEHQNCALAILSSDEKLMRFFLKEKDKMRHQSYPVDDHDDP